MFTLPVINVQADPLDALLAALGYRLISLAGGDNASFHELLRDKNISLHFTSDDGVSRYYNFANGKITQAIGSPSAADLTVNFKSSLIGAKLLTKADIATLMTAIQDGDMQIEGDYKLVLWFTQLGKYAAKIPDEYQPYVETVKPYWNMAKPYANKLSRLAWDNITKVKQKLG
ncbi:MAG: hypothetical protein Q4G13_10045 [Moraxella sp.]|nr:hypothetical protein [Moraxella sp.]